MNGAAALTACALFAIWVAATRGLCATTTIICLPTDIEAAWSHGVAYNGDIRIWVLMYAVEVGVLVCAAFGTVCGVGLAARVGVLCVYVYTVCD